MGEQSEVEQIEITIAVSNDAPSIHGDWAASLVEHHDLDGADALRLSRLTGYGDSPLAAMASLLNRAVREKRGSQSLC